MKASEQNVAIGIDLGTTNSCVAVFKNGQLNVIQNDHGNRVTPSMVAFDESEELVGEEASKVTISGANNAIFGVKRLMGRWLDHQSVQSAMLNWPYKIVSEHNRPKIEIEVNGEKQRYYPEEVSAKILKKLKVIAEDYLGHKVSKAVVTVPAQFDDNQRHKTKEACLLAGLEPIGIINEPTAAAIAYAVDKATISNQEQRTVVVYDVGGGTMDVTVLRAENGTFQTLATDGNSHLAGEDFNQNLFDFLKEIIRRTLNVKVESPKSVAKLRKACEETKCSLSFKSKKTVRIDSIGGGKDFETVVTRQQFESINEDLFRSTIAYVKSALQAAEVEKSEVDDVVLIGGSSRIPRLQELLSEFFDGRELRKSINPDEAVAVGAAIRAASLTNAFLNFNLILMEVVPLSLGTSIQGNVMDVLIKRNTKIPCSSSKTYTTLSGNQEVVEIDIYQGERPLAKDNVMLGKVRVEGIRRAAPGVPEIVTTFEIDEDGMLHVSAHDRQTPHLAQKTLVTRETLSQEGREMVERTLRDHDKRKEMDEEAKEAVLAKNRLESFCYETKYFVESEEMDGKIDPDKRDSIMSIIEFAIEECENPEGLKVADFEGLQGNLVDAIEVVKTEYIHIYNEMFRRE